jgi:ferrous iron transport protein B
MIVNANAAGTVVVVGKESAGKSRLISSLTGRYAEYGNFAGTTVACEEYRLGERVFVDTPGILRHSDTETTRLALAELAGAETVLVVVRATTLDRDLPDLLPLLEGRRAALMVTFRDAIRNTANVPATCAELARELAIPVVAVDARSLTADDREAVLNAVESAGELASPVAWTATGWQSSLSTRPAGAWNRGSVPATVASACNAILALFIPAVVAVWVANGVAAAVDPLLASWREPLVAELGRWTGDTGLVRALLIGSYGLVTMGPMLLVWAVPTVLMYAVLLGAYKASGLVDWINVALHPLVRPIGLSGRDVVRVVMGFGCNVPAVISTRACSSCSRGSCISAIAFGAACSYQFPATLAVFAAAGRPGLVVPYLGYLFVTTIAYLWVTAPRKATSPLNVLVVEPGLELVWPGPKSIWQEARSTIVQFFVLALPVFFLITLVASLLDWLGVVSWAAGGLGPVMGLFNLPAEAALPVVLASIRKDGILLFTTVGEAGPQLAVAMTSVQLLTGVYLAGVLLPCLVTALTIAREKSWRFTSRLLAKQAVAAVLFSLALAWGGRLIP